MKKVFLLVLAGSLLSSACTAKEGIEIRDPWTRPTAKGENGAVYFILHNHSKTVDGLVGASAEIAQAVEIHESTMTNDVMQMQMLQYVPLEGNEMIEFSPGGLHIMLVNLQREVKLGDSIVITLHFRVTDDVVVNVSVQESDEGHGH